MCKINTDSFKVKNEMGESMYLHLGGSVVILQRNILGIFDLDNTTYSRITRDFLARAEKNGQVITVGEDLPKSFLLCVQKDGTPLVYLSQLSSATLLRRMEVGGGLIS